MLTALGPIGIALLAVGPGRAGAATPAREGAVPRLVWAVPDPELSRPGHPAAVPALARGMRDRLPPCTPIRVAPGDEPGAPDVPALVGQIADALAEDEAGRGCPGAGMPPLVGAARVPQPALWGLGLARGAAAVALGSVAVRGPRVEVAVAVRPVAPVRRSLPFAPVWPAGWRRQHAGGAAPAVIAAPLDAPLRALLSLPTRPRSSGSVVARASAPLALGGPVAAASAALRGHLLVATDRELIDLAVGQDLRGRPEASVLHRRPLPPRRGAGSPRPFGMLTVAGAAAAVPDRTLRAEIAGRAAAASTVAGDGRWGPWGPLAGSQDCPETAADGGPALDRMHTVGGGCALRVPPGDRLAADPWPGVFFSRVRRVLEQPGVPPVRFEAATTGRGAVTARVDGREVAVRGHGAALGLADLEGDGTAELLVSGDGDDPAGDRLHLLRLRGDGALRAVWRSAPLEGRVWVATGGDVDGDGGEELVAIEEMPGTPARARLWVVR